MIRQICTFSIFILVTAIGLFLTNSSEAQGTFTGGEELAITFSATSGPATNQPFGGASFFQTGWDYGTSSSVSNLFVVSFNLGNNAASDGWILQMNNGSLLPVLEISNEFANPLLISGTYSGDIGSYPGIPSSAPYSYSQGWALTDDQAQNLLAGNWYAEIEYGDNTYLGNFAVTGSGASPVPEPETFTLLALGMAAIFIRRRK